MSMEYCSVREMLDETRDGTKSPSADVGREHEFTMSATDAWFELANCDVVAEDSSCEAKLR